MAFALSLSSSVALQRLPSSSSAECVFLGHSRPTNFLLPRRLLHPSTLTFARRRHNNHAVTSTASSSSKRKKSNKAKENIGNDGNDSMEENLEGDPLEALFSMLEDDLKNDASATEGGDDDDEITEEDIDRLASEFEEALGDFEMGAIDSSSDDTASDADEDDDNDEEEDEDDDEEEEEERPVKLKNWQLRRLAYALKVGRRKTNIKSLAADLCLDRAVVLQLLRDPPPNLILMSATLPDEPTPVVPVSETKPIESEKITVEAMKPERKVKEPIHVIQHRWSAQKRLKKVQVETLERVYRRSKRPTNAMISSIVHVTNLPRKRVLKWFEDKRNQDEIPDHRLPYERSVPGTITSH